MTSFRSHTRALALLLACHGLCACELIADFDRGKLDMGEPDSGVAVPAMPTAGSDDQNDSDAGSADGSDAGTAGPDEDAG